MRGLDGTFHKTYKAGLLDNIPKKKKKLNKTRYISDSWSILKSTDCFISKYKEVYLTFYLFCGV